MATIEDLRPQPFTITIRDVSLQCNPLRLEHGLLVAKIAAVFQNMDKVTRQDIITAQQDFDYVVTSLVPELKDIPLNIDDSLSVIEQMQTGSEPSDDKYLKEQGVKLGDPKDQTTAKETTGQ